MKKHLRAFALVLSSVAVACGGSQTPKPPTNDTTDAAAPPSNTFDEVLEYEAVEVQGMLFHPQAIGLPGMWKISTPRRATLKKQRKVAAKSKAKAADLQVLAALAWNESSKVRAKARKQPDEAKRAALDAQVKTLRIEARDALRRAYAKAGAGKADEITLKLLSVAEITLGDVAAATKVYAEIVERFPPKGASGAAIWLAHLYLAQGQLSNAAKLTSGWSIADGMNPMAAYLLAWVKFQQRDYATSTPAILFAAKNWKSKTGRRYVSNDVLLFLARAGVSVADARTAIVDLVGDTNKTSLYAWFYRMSKGYEFSGYEDRASTVLGILLSGDINPQVPARDAVVFRAERAYDALRAGDVETTASSAIEAHQKLAECGEACAKEAANVANAVRTYATLLHTLYAHSLDEAYYTAAKKLYDYYLVVPEAPEVEVIKGYASRLADTKANANPTAGKYDKAEMQKLLRLRLNAVKACYESVLQSEPTLAGTVVLKVQLESTGMVVGTETEPAKGAAGLAAVAGCLQQRAKTWVFPKRTVEGTSTMVQPFKFAPAPAPAAK